MHDFEGLSIRLSDGPTRDFFHHSSGQRVNTDIVLIEAIRREHPKLHMAIVPVIGCDLIAFAANTGEAKVVPIIDTKDALTIPITRKRYLAPARRSDAGNGIVVQTIVFGKYLYTFQNQDYVLYIVDGRDGTGAYPTVNSQYLVGPEERYSNNLIKAASEHGIKLHNEIWVYDQGFWQKSSELYQSVMKARWEDVILDEDMKKSVQTDVDRFFNSQEKYRKLRIPYKRGVIYYGPPGNGKTISVKAIMHTLLDREDPIPSLYARRTAPCLLIFEDLDTIVTDQVRSYFLNEVDGLVTNDGVLMVGSTNHLDRLDPSISKRPSRFDRKFLFPKPNLAERTQYCNFWRGKLADNEDFVWPDGLSEEIAAITDDFSFAYLQEAFTAALLAIAAHDEDEEKGVVHVSKDKFDDLAFWREIKKQIELLRGEI